MKDFLNRAKAVLSNYRYYVLTLLLTLTVVLLMADVNDDVTGVLFFYLILSTKLLAFAFGYLFYRLYKRWEAKGTIPEMTDSINKF